MYRITAINEDIGSEDEDENQVTKEAEVFGKLLQAHITKNWK